MRRLTQSVLIVAAAATLLVTGWVIAARLEVDQPLSTARLALAFIGLAGALGLTLFVLLRQYRLAQDNRRLQAALAHQAITDDLTALANRRRCDEVLAQEVRRAERYRRPLSVLRLDVDDFRRYNDRHGHQKGDMLLRVIAGLLREQLRASDLPARYGGDEFVIILPEISANRSAAVAEKLHAAVSAAFGPDEGVSVSIGCAAFEAGLTPEALLALADQDMHRVKIPPVRA